MFFKKKATMVAAIVALAAVSLMTMPELSTNAAIAQTSNQEAGTTSQTTTLSNNNFVSSVNVSPIAGTNAKVTIEGNGLTPKQLNVNQGKEANDTVKITIDALFMVKGSSNANTTSATTPSANATTSANGTSATNANTTSATTPSANAPLGTASITTTPTSANAGGTISVQGKNFGHNQPVSIIIDQRQDTHAVRTDSDGAFTLSLSVPNDLTGGSHQITGTDGEGTLATGDFNVTASSNTSPTA